MIVLISTRVDEDLMLVTAAIYVRMVTLTLRSHVPALETYDLCEIARLLYIHSDPLAHLIVACGLSFIHKPLFSTPTTPCVFNLYRNSIMSRVTAKQGVTFVCDSLKAFGIDYIGPDSFRLAKANDPTVKPDFQRLASDVLSLGLTNLSSVLSPLRSFDPSLKAVSAYCALAGVYLGDDSSTIETMLIACWLLGSFGPAWIEGYRRLITGPGLVPVSLETYSSVAVLRSACEQSTAVEAKLSATEEISMSKVMQILNRRKYLERLQRDLFQERSKISRKTPQAVLDWIRDTDPILKKQKKEAITRDIAFQADCLKEVGFWEWLGAVAEDHREVFSDVQVVEEEEEKEDIDLAGLRVSLLSRANDCLKQIEDRGISVRRGFLSR